MMDQDTVSMRDIDTLDALLNLPPVESYGLLEDIEMADLRSEEEDDE